MSEQKEQQVNGAGQNGQRAGLKEMFVGSEGSDYFDLPKELLEATTDFSKLWARARLSETELSQINRVLADIERYDRGSTDIRQLVYRKLASSIGLNGEARKEAIAAQTGGQSWMSSLKQPVMKFAERFSSTNDRRGPSQ
jgi:hypothetical protein